MILKTAIWIDENSVNYAKMLGRKKKTLKNQRLCWIFHDAQTISRPNVFGSSIFDLFYWMNSVLYRPFSTLSQTLHGIQNYCRKKNVPFIFFFFWCN